MSYEGPKFNLFDYVYTVRTPTGTDLYELVEGYVTQFDVDFRSGIARRG